MYVAPQDESCRHCYDLCRELRLLSLRAIWYMCTLTGSPFGRAGFVTEKVVLCFRVDG